MSTYNVGIVAEGPRDIDILENLLYKIFPEHEFVIKPLQPEGGGDVSEKGCGWKGVKRWFEDISEEYNTIHDYMNVISPKIDFLIIHIDIDVVYESDLNIVDLPKVLTCPIKGFERDIDRDGYDKVSLSDKVDFLQNSVVYWTNNKFKINEYSICNPSDNMESWILFAFTDDKYHIPPNQCIESLQKPDSVIAKKSDFCGVKISRRSGKLEKKKRLYIQYFIPKLIEKWDCVKKECEQAMKFEDSLKQLLDKLG